MVQPIYDAAQLPPALSAYVREKILFHEYVHKRSEKPIELSCYQAAPVCDRSINIFFENDEYLVFDLTSFWQNVVLR